MSYDRRAIAPLMLPHFPGMADTGEHAFSSDEWHGFMNAVTGLDVPITERNGAAFDQWRQALARTRNLPVWSITPEKEARIRMRGEQLLAAAEAVAQAQPQILAMLNQEAPGKTAGETIRDYLAAIRHRSRLA